VSCEGIPESDGESPMKSATSENRNFGYCHRCHNRGVIQTTFSSFASAICDVHSIKRSEQR
jgi:hypothetical protein